MNKKSTKRALLLSALSLLLCVSMLVGTTFAWFTDSVTSGSNIIQSGKLEIALLDEAGNSLEGEVIEWAAADGRAQDQILWEPGCTYNTEKFFVKNTGNLNLKFKVMVNGVEGDAKLLEAIEFTMNGAAIEENVIPLAPGQTSGAFVLSGHMKEEAGNEYQGLTITGISITVLATQDTVEKDSFDENYDELASFAFEAIGKLEDGAVAVSLQVRDENETKIASAEVPAGAIDTTADAVKLKVERSEYKANITIAADQETKAYDVTVTGLKDGNTTPIKVQLRAPAGLDPNTVKLYHNDTEIACTYNPTTGYVAFESTSFSPFTIVYDAESQYVPPVTEESDLPVAVVTEYTDTANIQWGNYGQWSPTEGLEANLDAAYKFACPANEDIDSNPYANWFCDFYVKLDKDLGENEIFLGGNYGDFGWVGFHNGELTLAANTEIGLLESVTTNPWTYADVYNFVGEFICGVGNVDNSLSGATFTVMLRLTNPENPAEFYNVNTVTYTWPTIVNNGQELQDAVNNGDTNIQLGGDIDLSQGLVIPGN